FQYFGEYYGLELYALQGISPEADIRIVDFLRIVNLIKALNIPAIFAESTINPKIIEKIAYTARCSVGDKLYADSLSDQDGPAASYLSMIDYNVHTIVNALLLEYNGQKLIEDALQPTTILMLFMTILVMMLSFLYLMCK
nr:zinc ABC transporter substrate-binding protein [Saprospiraceae bacterium]